MCTMNINFNKGLLSVAVAFALVIVMAIPVFAETFNGNNAKAACEAKYTDCIIKPGDEDKKNPAYIGTIPVEDNSDDDDNGNGNGNGTGSGNGDIKINNRNQCERAGGTWVSENGSNGNGECEFDKEVEDNGNGGAGETVEVTPELKPAKTSVF